MVAPQNVLHHLVEEHKGPFNRTKLSELSGMIRMARNETGLIPMSEIAEDLDHYRDPDTTGHTLFIGRVAFNALFEDNMEMGGFATMHRKPEGHHIDRLYVHSVARGRMLGHQLLEACIDKATKVGGYLQYDRIPETEAEARVLADFNFQPNRQGTLQLALPR